MEGFNPNIQISRSAPRPMGLWVLAACNLAIALELALGPIWVLSILYEPEPVDIVLGIHAELWAWMMLAVLAGICLFTAGVVTGNRGARIVLLLLLAAVSLAGLWDSYCFAVWYQSAGYTLHDLTWFGLRNGSIGIRFVAWLGVNFWYLFVAQSRQFFL